MDVKYVIKNYTRLIIGLFIIAMGIALSIRANIGTSPISCIPYVLSLEFPLSIGILTFLFNVILVVVQLLLLRNSFPRKQYLQVLLGLIFGLFTDLTLWLTTGLVLNNYLNQWLCLILSCFVIALGVIVELGSDAVYLAPDGTVLALRHVTHKEFGKVKTCFDVTIVSIGFILSYIFFGKFMGVGLGTIFAAIFVGYIVRFYRKIIDTITELHNKHEIKKLKNKTSNYVD